jgi:hypothetical protein
MVTTYFGLLKKSWNDFRKNPALVLPVLLSLVVLFLFFIVAVLELLLFLKIFGDGLPIPWNLWDIYNSPTGLTFSVFFILVDCLLLLLAGSYVRSMRIGMYREVIQKKKTSLENMFKSGGRYFKRCFQVSIIKVVFIITPLIILGWISLLIFLSRPYTGLVVFTFSFVIFFFYLIIIAFGFFFIEPIITEKNKQGWTLVKTSFGYTKKNIFNVIKTWLVIFLVGLVAGLVLQIFDVPFGLTGKALYRIVTGGIAVWVNLFLLAVKIIVGVILQIIFGLFIFHVYFVKKRR